MSKRKKRELVDMEIDNFINYAFSSDKERKHMRKVRRDFMKEVFDI